MAKPHIPCAARDLGFAVLVAGWLIGGLNRGSQAQLFQISRAQLDGPNHAVIEYQSQPNARFVLLQGNSVLNISTPAATNSGSAGLAQFSLPLLPEASGMFFQIRRDIGLATLARPTLTTTPVSTKESGLLLSGTATPNAALRIDVSGGATAFGAAGADGTFALNVPLQVNKLNRLFVTASDNAGNTSAAQPVEVLQDSQPPTLFIDFPGSNQEVTTDQVVVAGRVGDLLSGFLGLDVRLVSSPSEGPAPWPDSAPVATNWPTANVLVGIGNNGTFERGNVPLAAGRNVITAVARDVLGNTVLRQITLTRTTLAGPRMAVVSGDRQATNVHRPLAQPIVVRITQEDGVTPLANKVVTFAVTRSDGRLVADPNTPTRLPAQPPAMTLQVLTDAAGLASAFWTLGGDAGCGNNRVSVTSRDIAGTVFFCASANPAPASQINVSSGNNQRAEAGAPAHEPLRAWVNDSCNGVPGIPVVFTVMRGGGKLRDPGNPGGADSTSLTLPSAITGHAAAAFELGPDPGPNVIDATYVGNAGGHATFTVTGVARDPAQVTSFSGLVLDNTSQPIGGAQCLLTVGGGNFFIESGPDGRFEFDSVPSGPARLQVNGLEATTLMGKPILPGSYPALTFSPVLIANAANALPKPVLLPKLNPNNAQAYDGTKDVELTCEGIAGLKMVVKAGSMRRVDGSVPSPRDPATIALNPVHIDSVPMPIPDGAAPQFTWTLQPGGSVFDPPVSIQYPNMSGLPAGTVTFFLSFNHDTEKFEIIASGHVTADGSTIETDPGVGLKVAGWGCNCPPYSVTGSCTNGFPHTAVKDTTTNRPPANCTTNCIDAGSLHPGTVDQSDPKACPGQPLTFTAPPVSDSGGTMALVCTNPDGSKTTTTFPIGAVPVTYDWVVFRDGLAVMSGQGNTATVIPRAQGTYVCVFTASAARACPPGALQLPPQSATVYRLNLSMQNLLEENETNTNIPNETNPGAILFVNDNDNDGSPGVDKDATNLPLSNDDPDLEPFFIQMLANPGEGIVTLSVPAGTKVWKDRRKNPTQLSWDLGSEALPGVLYIEGLQVGSGNLVATYAGAFRCQDTVKVNVLKAMLLIGAENEQDTALNDDWVGVNGHRILNFVTVTGPPKLVVPLTLDYEPQPDPLADNVPSTATITIIPVQRTVAIGATGTGASPFEIRGGNRSVFTEDIKVRAKYQNRTVAEETLTVLQFNVLPITSGQGHSPSNPSVVTPLESEGTENLFGSTAKADGFSDFEFTTPNLNGSAKLSPGDIEVLWGREVNGMFLDSDQETGLFFPVDATDRAKVIQTTLRMQDTSVPSGLGDLTPLTYYLGHRTSLNAFLPKLPENNVGSVAARFRPLLTYPVVLHLLSGPTKNSGLTGAQVIAIMTDVNRVWSQAGIRFTVLGTFTENLADDGLLDATTSTVGPLGLGDAATISLMNRDGRLGTPAIDIYFVAFLYDSASAGPAEPQLNGLTITRLQAQTGLGIAPCVLIGGPNSQRTAQGITRTLAHELGHYLFNSFIPPNDHVSDDRNLMYGSGSETKRDLNDAQVDAARSSTAPKDVQ